MMGAELFGFKAIMLDGIELLAHGSGMPLPSIPDPLEVGAMNLSPLRQTPVEERLEAIPEQGMLIFDLRITVTLHAFELATELWVCRFGTGELFQLPIQFCNSLIVDPANK